MKRAERKLIPHTQQLQMVLVELINDLFSSLRISRELNAVEKQQRKDMKGHSALGDGREMADSQYLLFREIDQGKGS